jgi:deoxyribodipyrimidine photo-lyase
MKSSSIKISNQERLIVWIRHEFRLHDNRALWNACRDAKEVIPLFVIDDEFRSHSPAKQQVIIDGLHDLHNSLRRIGGSLIIREGSAARILSALIDKTQSTGIYCSRSFDPENRSQDVNIRKQIEKEGKIWVEFQDHLLFNPEEITTGSKTPHTVFTPFRNACNILLQEIPPPLPSLRCMKTPALEAGNFLERHPPALHSIMGGEKVAIQAMNSFINRHIQSYHELRDLPAMDGTSRLSHHLATGSLSIRKLLHETLKSGEPAKPGGKTYINELLWREFFYHVVWHFPHVISGSFKKGFDRLEWSGREEWFEVWCSGKTGYPIVDAAMRQLNTVNWMHNRARMIVASFLTKDLHIDWRRGEEYFLKKLADGDMALNNGGWQWSAGTGTDAQPWFRIFNPVLQGKKFDPQGTYVRMYIPELQDVPRQYIHEPWKLSLPDQKRFGCVLGKDYPLPIVHHDEERKKTLTMYQSIKRHNHTYAP